MQGLKPFLRFPKSITYYSYVTVARRHFSTHQTRFDHVGPMASLLKSRSVVRFRGPDTVKFLQGLLTNNVQRFCESPGDITSNLVTPNVPFLSASPMYALMLTPQGRFLYDLFLYRPSRPSEKLDRTGSSPGEDLGRPLELLADVDATVMDELLERFNKYRLRADVVIENVAEEFSCWQRYGDNLTEKLSSADEPEAASVGWGGANDPAGTSSSHGNNVGLQWFKDPRLDSLGFRGIFPSNTTPPLVEADKETDEENYLLWRLEKGVAEGSTEIPKGDAVPLEYNLAGLNAISFDKGCYVGQELIARTHHRGVIRKRLLPLKFLDESGKEMGQKVAPAFEVINALTGKKAGTVTTALNGRGLGLLRLEEALKGSSKLTIKGQEDVKVEAIRPEWWPTEWFQEYQQDSAAA